jgi:hypothetical protein
MKRRTLLGRVGATGVAATAVAGRAAAGRSGRELGIDREIDVSSVSGETTLDALLEPQELESLPEDVDPRQFQVAVSDGASSISLDDCCSYCCKFVCDCSCCTCDSDPDDC